MRSLAMQSLTNDYKARYPGVTIYGVGDDAHRLRASDHNEDDTPGSNAAQSDSDNIPEHRAIDVMLGPAFSRAQALATISEILADPKDRARLRFINFEKTQWHMNNGWEPADNSDDPHPTHIHYSGLAAMDHDASPWLGGDMYEQNDRNTAQADTWRLLTVLENRPSAEYQLTGEATPRKEPNLLRAQLIRIEDGVKALADNPANITLSDEQMDQLARKVADLILGPMATASRAYANSLDSSS